MNEAKVGGLRLGTSSFSAGEVAQLVSDALGRLEDRMKVVPNKSVA
jgi:hypothetical protein